MLSLDKNKKQTLTLLAASVIGMVLGIGNSALNTHYLNPEAYGNVRYVQNIITFFSSVLLLGFFVSGSRLLALSEDKIKSQQIRGGMTFILGITLLLLMIIMGLWAIWSYTHGDSVMGILYLAAIPTCGNILFLNYINTTAQGDNHIGRIASARIFPPLIYFLIAFPLFYFYGASSLLMLVLFNGSAVVILGYIIISTKPSYKNLKTSIKWLVEENKRYGLHVYFGSLAGVSTSYIAGISLGYFMDNNVDVGYYTLALSLSTPLSLLPSIIGTTHYKRFAHEPKINSKVFIGTIILTFASWLIFIAGLKILVPLVYPVSYSGIFLYGSYLGLSACLFGLGDMINRFMGSHGLGVQIRNASYSCGAIILVGSIIGVYYYGITGAIITRILGASSYVVVLSIYYLHFIRNGKQESV